MPWYASARDLPQPDFCELELLRRRRRAAAHASARASRRRRRHRRILCAGRHCGADLVPAAARGCARSTTSTRRSPWRRWKGDRRLSRAAQVPPLDLYLSFTGGPLLDHLAQRFGARRAARALLRRGRRRYTGRGRVAALGPRLSRHLRGGSAAGAGAAADRAGAPAAATGASSSRGRNIPPRSTGPTNVERIEHVPPADHAAFYAPQHFTLNVTRADMVAAGWSPSVRLFEAAACGTPIISDRWDGLQRIAARDRHRATARTMSSLRLKHTADAARAPPGRGPAGGDHCAGTPAPRARRNWKSSSNRRSKERHHAGRPRNDEVGPAVAHRGAGPWFHNLDSTASRPRRSISSATIPRCKWRDLADAVPADLTGWTVLDIGCNAGFYALEMKRRGADRVVAIDSDPRYLRQAHSPWR